MWWLNGKRHRIDGPAIEYADRSKEWWANGKKIKKTDIKLYQLIISHKE